MGNYAFSFTRAVSNLTFTLTDIDSTSGDFLDAVQLTPGFTWSNRAAGLTGVGTSADPFRQTSADVNANNSSSGAGNVTITYPGPLTTFTISYANGAWNYSVYPAQANPLKTKVKRGDTLGLIARRTNTTIAQLKNWNRLRTANLRAERSGALW